MKRLAKKVILAILFSTAGSSFAAVSFVYSTPNGTLLLEGVKGVYDVWSNKTYDVLFQDGSCNSLFSGCSSTVFSFITSGSVAQGLNQALANTVLSPSGLPPGAFQIRGCEPSALCYILTPVNSNDVTSQTLPVYTHLLSRSGQGAIGVYATDKSFETAVDSYPYPYTYAVWSLSSEPIPQTSGVPEPASVAMALAGLCVIARATFRRT